MDNKLKEKDNGENEKECRLGLKKQGYSTRNRGGETWEKG